MSECGGSDSSNEPFEMSSFINSSELHSFTHALKALEDELSYTIQGIQKLQKKVHAAEHTHQDLYKVTGLHDILHQFIPFWKEEGRLSTSGSLVRLTKEERRRLELDRKDTQEWISIYTVANAMLKVCLKEQSKN